MIKIIYNLKQLIEIFELIIFLLDNYSLYLYNVINIYNLLFDSDGYKYSVSMVLKD